MNKYDIERVKQEILAALAHSEASDGLYARNLVAHNRRDERPLVHADPDLLGRALASLTAEGRILREDEAEMTIFRLAGS